VLAFTPALDGKNFQTVDRPNVVSVRRESEGQFDLLRRGLWGVIGGLLLYAAGLVTDFGSLLALPSTGSEGPAQGTGLDRTVQTMQQIFDLFALVDDLMVLVGTAAFFVGLLLVAGYVYTRTRYLSIRTAGDETDVHIPIGGSSVGEHAIVELETAIFPEGEPPESGSLISGLFE